MEDFTIDEINSALKKLKGKMSAGVDGIPLKLVKMFGQSCPLSLVNLFNSILRTGFPQKWKLARVVPVPEKGDLTDVKNYRPVSNLCSTSKLFERCVLARMMSLPTFDQLIGAHQHGFRANHSTTSCLMELKDKIADNLDAGRSCIVYSLDLSAAFDMLRVDTFYDKFNGVIRNGILKILVDFLSDRECFVNVGDANSEKLSIERGCPQGSVLGPVLFNLYVGDVMSNLISCDKVAYADDSYVINHGCNLEEAIDITKNNIKTHTEALKNIGMIVNQGKTEIVVMSKAKQPPSVTIDVGQGICLDSSSCFKALGVWIDHRLCWDKHISELRKRVIRILNGLKIIRRKLTLKQATTIVTSQALSILYYGSCAWLTPSLGKKEMAAVESIHFKSLRIIMRDYKQRMSRDFISQQLNRLPPKLWCRFACASFLMKMWYSGYPTLLKSSAYSNTYTKVRYPGQIFRFDSSKTKIGRQITKNWCGSVLGQIKVAWSNDPLSNDRIRMLLKSTFYPHNFIAFNF